MTLLIQSGLLAQSGLLGIPGAGGGGGGIKGQAFITTPSILTAYSNSLAGVSIGLIESTLIPGPYTPPNENFFIYSGDQTNPAWTIAQNTVISPDATPGPVGGEANAFRFQITTSGSLGAGTYQTPVLAASTQYTFWVWVMATQASIDAGLNMFTPQYNSSAVVSGGYAATTSWAQYPITFTTTTAGAYRLALIRSYPSNPAVDILTAGFMVNAGATPDPYISTQSQPGYSGPLRTIVATNPNNGTISTSVVTNFTTTVIPLDYTSLPNHQITVVVQDTAADNIDSIRQGLVVHVVPPPVVLNPLTLSSGTGLAAGVGLFTPLVAASGYYSGTAFTRSYAHLTTDTAGTLYTGTQAQVTWNGQVVASSSPLTFPETLNLYLQEDMGGNLRYTPVVITTVSVTGPTGLHWAPASPALLQSVPPGPRATAGTLTANTQGTNNFVTWALTTNPGIKFDVDRRTGNVYVIGNLSAPSFLTSYSLVATATDRLGHSATVSFTVTITADVPQTGTIIDYTLYGDFLARTNTPMFADEFEDPRLPWMPSLITRPTTFSQPATQTSYFGPWTPNGLLNTAAKSGTYNNGSAEQSWYLDQRWSGSNPVLQTITQSDSEYALQAYATPPQLFPYIGANSTVLNAPPASQYIYCGAEMTTTEQYKLQQGLFRARLKQDPISGTWIGVWMFAGCGNGAEIDLVEVFGTLCDGYDNSGNPINPVYCGRVSPPSPGLVNYISTTLHSQLLANQSLSQYVPDYSTTPYGDWLEVAVIVDATTVGFYVNSVLTQTFTAPGDYKQPFFLLADVTVRKAPYIPGTLSSPVFINGPSPTAPYPGGLHLDFYRAYKKLPTVPVVPVTTNTKTTAYLAAVAAAGGSLTGPEQTALNHFYNLCDAYQYDSYNVGQTIWQKQDQFYFHWANANAAKISLVTPGTFSLTKVGTVTEGAGFWQSDGTTGYMETGWSFVTQAAGLTGRDGRMSVLMGAPPSTPSSTDSFPYIYGTADWQISAWQVPITGPAPVLGGLCGQVLAQNAAYGFGVPHGFSTLPRGVSSPQALNKQLYSMERITSGKVGGGNQDCMLAYNAGDYICGFTTSATTNVFTDTTTVQIGRVNAAGTVAGYTDAQIGHVSWGPSMTWEEHQIFDAAVYAVMHVINPTLYP